MSCEREERVNAYKTVYRGVSAEVVEKKSRFIADLAHVETEEEAQDFLAGIRRKYWDARHHCSAWILGKKQEIKRCSDDGEPSQTAGKPMLDVLSGEGLCDTILVVTRYFGGTLLGTGGLVRAYSEAAKAGIAASDIIEKLPADLFTVQVDYHQVGKLLYLAGQRGLEQLSSDYGEKVCLKLLVPAGESAAFSKEITEAFSGSVVPETEDYGYFAKGREGLLLFPGNEG